MIYLLHKGGENEKEKKGKKNKRVHRADDCSRHSNNSLTRNLQAISLRVPPLKIL